MSGRSFDVTGFLWKRIGNPKNRGVYKKRLKNIRPSFGIKTIEQEV